MNILDLKELGHQIRYSIEDVIFDTTDRHSVYWFVHALVWEGPYEMGFHVQEDTQRSIESYIQQLTQ